MGELNNFFVSFGAITKDFLKGKKEVEDGLKDIDTAAKAQGKSMDQSGKQAEAAMDRTGDAAVEAAAKINKLKDTILAANQALKTMATQMQIAGGIITGALTAVVYQAADLGDKIDDLTKRTGVSAEELTRWGYVAEQNGSSLDQMALALKNLYTRMDEAGRGTQQYKEVFDRLGISVRNMDGSLKSGSQIIPEIADKIAALGSEVEQSALLAELFGQRVGPDLLPMLQMGSGGIKELADEADRIGRTMSGEMAKSLGDFNDSITALKASVGGLAAQFSQALVPALQPIVQWITNLIAKFTEWRERNQALFNILAKIAALSGPLLILGGTFLKIMLSLVELGNKAQNLGKIFSVLQADVKKFFSFFLTPAGIATAAIAGIATAVYILYDRWKGVIERTQQAREALIRIKDGKASIEEIKAALDGAEEAIQKNIKAVETWHRNLNFLESLDALGSGIKFFNEILGIEKKATGEIEAQTQLLRAELSQAAQIAAEKMAEGFEGATQAEKETLTEAIRLNETVKQGSQEMETFRTAIATVKEELATLAPGSDQFKTSQEALSRLEKGYENLFTKTGENATKFNEIFRSLTEEQREYVLTGKQKEVEIHQQSLLERLEAEKSFSKLVIDEQIKVLEAYKKNAENLTDEEKKEIESLLDSLKTKFDELNQAARERLSFTKTLLDLGKVSTSQYVQFLKDELVSEQNTAEQKKNIRNELLNYTASLYTKNLDALKSSNEKAIDLERDTAEKRKEIYDSYAQKVIDKEEEIHQIRQKYADKQKDLGASIRTQLVADLAGYGENLSGLFNKSTEELAAMWKRAAESGKSMKPLTEDAKRQVELYGEAWEEAAKQIELASKVEEFMNLDAAMQEEIEKVNARFADFETKTAESLDKVNAAFLETSSNIQNAFFEAFENVGLSMETLSEKFGIELDSIEDKLNQFAGKEIRREQPIETAAKDVAGKSLPTIEALREYADYQKDSTEAYQESAEKIKLNIKSQEQLAQEIYNQKNKLVNIIAEVKESGILEASEGISSYSVATGQLVKTEYPELFKNKPTQDIAPVAEIKPEFPSISAVLPPERINQSADAVKNLGSIFKQNFIPLTGDVAKGFIDVSKEMGGFKGAVDEAVEAVQVLNGELRKLAGQNIKVEIDVQGTEKAGQQVVFKALEQSLLSGGARR